MKNIIKEWFNERFGFSCGFRAGYNAGLDVGADLCQKALKRQKAKIIRQIKALGEEPSRAGVIQIIEKTEL